MTARATDKRYLTFRKYLKEKYQCSVRKLLIHSSLNCPNRQKDLSGGCIFCNNRAFYPFSLEKIPVKQQIESQITRYRQSGRAEKFIAYFQTYTNTNAPVESLKLLYDAVTAFPEIVGIAIGTRPDCINEAIIDLIASYADRYEVWIEYGLQSANNDTLDRINRGHTFEDYAKAVSLTRRYPINICTHIILGLPGETHQDIMNTIRQVTDTGLNGIKFHPLQVIRDTQLEIMYNNRELTLLTEEKYVQWIVDCIEHLPESIVIQRVTADASKDYLVAPEWCGDKMHVIRSIDLEMIHRDTVQGRKVMNEI